MGLRTFPIEFIRVALEQTLLEEKIKNNYLFGGKNEFEIISLYRELVEQEDVDRFKQTFQDLAKQQNRSGLIGNGILLAPENPTITNLYSSLIVPMVFNLNVRVAPENRDQMLDTLYNLIETLKGRKVDVAQLKCRDCNNQVVYIPFCVGTLGEELDSNNQVCLFNGAFLGELITTSHTIPPTPIPIFTAVNNLLTSLRTNGVNIPNNYEPEIDTWFYVENNGQIKVLAPTFNNGGIFTGWQLLEDDKTRGDIIFPPTHTEFEKYKLSFSFDSIRCDEPRTLTAKEYCNLTLGGSATLVNNGVAFGNDLLRIGFTKKMIKGNPDVTFNNATKTWLEPLEMPSGSNANTNPNNLISNKMITNTHTDALALTLQYTFILDKNVPLLRQWYDYGRYGTQGITASDISPNMIYEINEFWCSWGDIENKNVNAKIVESIDIENTESDTLTLGLTFQLQGANS